MPMKLLLIASKHCEGPVVPKFIGRSITLTNNFETDIESIKNENADLIIIPAEQSTPYLESYLLGGLELLVWLRINEIDTHVIITSFFPLQTILQKNKLGFILGSKGISFLQLPKYKTIEYFKDLVGDKAENENLKFCFSSIVDIKQVRHLEANYYGLKKAWDIYNLVANSTNKAIPYPSIINTYLKDLKTVLLDFLQSKRNNIQPDNNIKDLLFKIRQKEIKLLQIDDQANDGWSEIIKNIAYGHSSKVSKEVVENGFEYYKNGRLVVKSINTKGLNNVNDFSIYFDEDEIFRKHEWDLIVLDLRLFPIHDDKHLHEVGEISGAIVLDLYRQFYKYDTTPILIASASNKIWTYKELIKIGADGYWMKEGVDDNFTEFESYSNFESLCFLLDKLTNLKYKSLRKFSKWASNFTFKNGWWVQQVKWKNGSVTKVKSPEVIEVLISETINQARIYLHQFEMENAFNSKYNKYAESYSISNLINKVGNIIEVIHCLNNETYRKFNVSELILSRGDFAGMKILSLRNEASHNSYSKLTWNDFVNVSNLCVNYLSNAPNKKKLHN